MVVTHARRATNRVLDLWPYVWLIIIPGLMFMPASYWYELKHLEVTGNYTAEGERMIKLDRVIHHNFPGEWRVEEQVLTEKGFLTVQACHGATMYRTDKALPEIPTLEWWKGDACVFEPPFVTLTGGEYRICTFITVRPRLFPVKHVEHCSAPFSR